ncbi:LysR family transcriptional regulator, partial [Vibrio lentus]|nr:LysR family transcriptional regulator [Vibrio lentus]
LSDHQCLATLHQTEWPLKSANIDVSGWLSSNDNHLLKQQAMAGSGIIRIASYYVAKEVELGELEQVLPDECLQQG